MKDDTFKKSLVDNKNNWLFNEYENFYQHYNAYINQLLELEPEYFHEYIKIFNNKFDNYENMDVFVENKMNEAFLIKIKELKKTVKEIEHFFSNFQRNKEMFLVEKNKYFIDPNKFRNDDLEKIFKCIEKAKENFENNLPIAMDKLKIKDFNVDNKSSNQETINNDEESTEYNERKEEFFIKNRKIYDENITNIKKIQKITHKKGKSKIILLTSLSIFLFLMSIVILIIYLI